jgi:hypothetical protein
VKQGSTGRVTAGFCWDWSDPDNEGNLRDDVVIGDYRRPWDARPEATKLAPGIPKASLWAYDPNGINQVGCIYTAQGFEFDYVGVIFGEDLIYNFDKQGWEGNQSKSSDSVVKRSGDKFVDLVKNTYRVLLSRGMKGCYVYFMNKDTERFFKSRIEYHKQPKTEDKPGVIIDISADKKFEEYLPVYSLKAAAGKFGEGEDVHEEGWMKVTGLKLNRHMFISKVIGHSMEPKIPDSSYCIFRTDTIGGTRQGKIVLVQSRKIHNYDNGGSYTVKRYNSEKEYSKDSTWKHGKIILESLNKDFKPIVLNPEDASEFKVIAEFAKVI